MSKVKQLDFKKFFVFPPANSEQYTTFYKVGKHLLFGYLKFGGNTVVFEPHNQIRQSDLFQKWFQTPSSVQILNDCIRTVSVHQTTVNLVQLLRSVSKSDKYITSASNCANLFKAGKGQRFLDLQILQNFGQNLNELEEFCQSCFELRISTYNNQFFSFLFRDAHTVQQKLKEYLNVKEVLTSGSEEFEFTVIQPGFDQFEVYKRVQAGKNKADLIVRSAVSYKRKEPDEAKIKSGVEQIAQLQKINAKKQKRKLDSKKLATCKPVFKQTIPASQIFDQIGNLTDEKHKIQKITEFNDENSESDLLIPTDSQLGKELAVKLRIYFDDSPEQQTQQYIGRTSSILNEQLHQRLLTFLPRIFSKLPMFVQYTSVFDGKHIQNLYNSFEPQTINLDCDQLKYNLHIDLSQIRFSQTTVVLVKANNQVFGFGFTGELKSTSSQHQANSFVFSLTQNQLYRPTDEFIQKSFDKLIVGTSGAAIVLQKNLLNVETSKCSSYNSPELFSGKRYDKFVEADAECIEIIRFVVD
ncbi:TLD_family protein [Hexamita inflata]|uniref:TLD family protein n=1 Tax=Hexamita inflata TaxID=28002 RepID=A0AA86R644_9EUKA|nr:TLD family protein [Hexamita inflata]